MSPDDLLRLAVVTETGFMLKFMAAFYHPQYRSLPGYRESLVQQVMELVTPGWQPPPPS
jgi:hypothetical protein